MSHQNQDVSKFLSYVLRHQPESIGLTLDSEGWANLDSLIACAAKKGRILDLPLIRLVVENSDKKRFSISDDGGYIRAVQGHSSKQVDISYEEQTRHSIFTMARQHVLSLQLIKTDCSLSSVNMCIYPLISLQRPPLANGMASLLC